MKFKRPLESHEIKSLFEDYKNNMNKEIRNNLIEHNLMLVSWTLNRYYIGLINYQDKDDLFQNGVLGLIQAIEKYDPQKGNFSPYAVYWIRSYINKYKINFTSDLSLDSEIDHAEDTTYKDIIADPQEAPFEEKIVDRIFHQEIKTTLRELLTDVEYRVLSMYFGLEGQGKTLEQISKSYNFGIERVRQIRNIAIRKIRRSGTFKRIEIELDLNTKFYRTSSHSHTRSKNRNHFSQVEEIVIARDNAFHKIVSGTYS